MKILKITINICLLLIIYSCTEESPTSSGDYTVYGHIVFKGGAASYANVCVDNSSSLKSVTDSIGYFEIKGVNKGNHELTASKDLGNGQFTERTTSIYVNDDTEISGLILPVGVYLYQPQYLTSKSLQLNWSTSDASDFREYKIYQHSTSGLDETTGTLIHISTSINDTIFNVSGLFPETEYFFRVYVMNDFGRLGGSNILDATTVKWDNEINFTTFYQLTQIANFPGWGGNIRGIDFDGEYLWILTSYSQGGYYDPNIVKLTQYDHVTGEINKEFEYDDEYLEAWALAVSDTLLYVLYAPFDSFYKIISMNSGSVLMERSASHSEDICIFNNFLFQSRVQSEGDIVEKLYLNNLNLIETFNVPNWEGTVGGITCREGEIWLSSRTDDQMIILNDQGEHIGVVDVDATYSHLCFMGNNIVIAKGNRIYIYQINNSN